MVVWFMIKWHAEREYNPCVQQFVVVDAYRTILCGVLYEFSHDGYIKFATVRGPVKIHHSRIIRVLVDRALYTW